MLAFGIMGYHTVVSLGLEQLGRVPGFVVSRIEKEDFWGERVAFVFCVMYGTLMVLCDVWSLRAW